MWSHGTAFAARQRLVYFVCAIDEVNALTVVLKGADEPRASLDLLDDVGDTAHMLHGAAGGHNPETASGVMRSRLGCSCVDGCRWTHLIPR
jgi:hypothetical protein